MATVSLTIGGVVFARRLQALRSSLLKLLSVDILAGHVGQELRTATVLAFDDLEYSSEAENAPVACDELVLGALIRSGASFLFAEVYDDTDGGEGAVHYSFNGKTQKFSTRVVDSGGAPVLYGEDFHRMFDLAGVEGVVSYFDPPQRPSDLDVQPSLIARELEE